MVCLFVWFFVVVVFVFFRNATVASYVTTTVTAAGSPGMCSELSDRGLLAKKIFFLIFIPLRVCYIDLDSSCAKRRPDVGILETKLHMHTFPSTFFLSGKRLPFVGCESQ
jgi:hypothetical protein